MNRRKWRSFNCNVLMIPQVLALCGQEYYNLARQGATVMAWAEGTVERRKTIKLIVNTYKDFVNSAADYKKLLTLCNQSNFYYCSTTIRRVCDMCDASLLYGSYQYSTNILVL